MISSYQIFDASIRCNFSAGISNAKWTKMAKERWLRCPSSLGLCPSPKYHTFLSLGYTSNNGNPYEPSPTWGTLPGGINGGGNRGSVLSAARFACACEWVCVKVSESV